MPTDHETFLRGDFVTVAGTDVLNGFRREDGWAHGITDDQLSFAGKPAMVINIGYYHGGIIFYQLGHQRTHTDTPDAFPGVWYEDCLTDYYRGHQDFKDIPLASEYYVVRTTCRNSQWYAVIADPDGIECICIRCYSKTSAEETVGKMRVVATQRLLWGFERRYGFTGTYFGE